MVFWDVLVAAFRRWYVVVLGLAITYVAVAAVDSGQDVYYLRGQAVFVSPASEVYPNKLRVNAADLITVAGIVGKRINGMDALPKTASSAATMVGRGVRDGVLITLPDNGVQWAPYFDTRALYIEVAAPDPEIARARHREALRQISADLQTLQDEQDVAADERVTIAPSPESPAVVQFRGQPRLAQLMVLVLGGGATLLCVAALERSAQRRRDRKPAAADDDRELARV
ncbi:hypothetical protein H1W00_06580 [Aeromicrobium sp. Marseille-Q0843]|uniref:Polysaccharide chain length determinant N-terminal domain-containing protein n=1 Tax=Aeromicrobium phoceense TaxID=2754045 RepID=A0A838X9F8_9ACTN|nr:hypothetical protein [Aeromicrobium phoceense]MBA4608139.1 hypothetical protein [Aeromicrobium phoceense]